MGRHRATKEDTSRPRLFGRRRLRDDLFERSFRSCSRCGEDVYVLAEDCRECGESVISPPPPAHGRPRGNPTRSRARIG